MNDIENNSENLPIIGNQKEKLTLTWKDISLLVNIKSISFVLRF